MALEITDASFESDIITSGKPAMEDFRYQMIIR